MKLKIFLAFILSFQWIESSPAQPRYCFNKVLSVPEQGTPTEQFIAFLMDVMRDHEGKSHRQSNPFRSEFYSDLEQGKLSNPISSDEFITFSNRKLLAIYKDEFQRLIDTNQVDVRAVKTAVDTDQLLSLLEELLARAYLNSRDLADFKMNLDQGKLTNPIPIQTLKPNQAGGPKLQIYRFEIQKHLDKGTFDLEKIKTFTDHVTSPRPW